MREVGEILSGGVLLGCLFGLLALLAAVVVCEFAQGWKVWRAKRHAAAMSILALVAVYVGGTKPPVVSVIWDEGLHDAGSAIDTNDLRRVDFRWSFDPWIPNVATFELHAVDKSELSPQPSSLNLIASCPVTNLALSVVMEREATNYIFLAAQSFVPDVPIVTNGVYHIQCVGGDNVWIPVGLKIYGDGNAISPPPPPQGENYLIDLIR